MVDHPCQVSNLLMCHLYLAKLYGCRMAVVDMLQNARLVWNSSLLCCLLRVSHIRMPLSPQDSAELQERLRQPPRDEDFEGWPDAPLLLRGAPLPYQRILQGADAAALRINDGGWGPLPSSSCSLNP